MASGTAERRLDEQLALRVFEGTASETGEGFYAALVEHLARALDARGAWVTEYIPERHRLRALAFWLGGETLKDLEYDIRGTPCEAVVQETRLVSVPDRMMGDPCRPPSAPEPGTMRHHLVRHGVVSYLGVPLLDGPRVLGHLGVVDTRPMPGDERVVSLFQLFASRALAEMRRLRLEAELRAREDKLARLVGSAMDGIIELDADLRITLMNPAAEKVFGCSGERLRGERFSGLLTPEAEAKLSALVRGLERPSRGDSFLWIAGGLMRGGRTARSFPPRLLFRASRSTGGRSTR